MVEALSRVKGMDDRFEEELVSWRHVESVARDVFLAYGFGEIRTPIIEEAALFVRGVGEGSDIVNKEMFLFDDGDPKDVTRVCLRPENTAAVVRALVEAGRIYADAYEKVFYTGAMFRREQPQAGRRRQFHQIGCEALGYVEPALDVEVIALVHTILQRLGIADARLLVNTLGDAADRPAYSAALVAYFEQHEGTLSDDSKRRLKQNPLRILDSKDERDRALVAHAPRTLDFLGDEAKKHFDAVTSGLAKLGVPFVVDSTLVRGLDYYTRTVFEFVGERGLGAQSTVCAGGRYDGLVETLGGRATPAVGFAGGIERLVLSMTAHGRAQERVTPALALIGADDTGRERAAALAFALRAQGVRVDVDVRGRGVKAQMRHADKSGARFTVVLGSREIGEGSAEVKEMATGAVERVGLDDAVLAAWLRSRSAPATS